MTEQKMWDYLLAAGLNEYGVSGLMANICAESGLNPQNLQNTHEKKLGFTDAAYTAAVDNGSYTNFVKDGAGYGLCQWTYPSRKANLLAYARGVKKSIGDPYMQLDFLLKELRESFAPVLSTLKTAASVREASDCVLTQFERPADMSEAVKVKRAGYGQKYYDKYARKGVLKLKLVESIMTKNPCYKAGKKIAVKGLMLHSVGCPQPSAAVFVKRWNSASQKSACVHGFIDANDGTVYQTLPWDHRGWHGGGTSNNTHIGVEMCEPACIRYVGGANFTCSDLPQAKAAAERTYQAAVELFAFLCEKYGLDPLADGVIVSHKEGHARGIASGHADPEHLWTQLKTGYTMDTFRKAVRAAMGGASVTPAPDAPIPAAFKPYTVRITATDLRIRKGPGTNHGIVEYIKPGVYTIVSEATGKGATLWGKLKSGVGWVSLDYCKKI